MCGKERVGFFVKIEKSQENDCFSVNLLEGCSPKKSKFRICIVTNELSDFKSVH